MAAQRWLMQMLVEGAKNVCTLAVAAVVGAVFTVVGTVAVGHELDERDRVVAEGPRPKKEYLGVEYDKTKRPASVYLHTSAPTNMATSERVSHRHWAIVVHFDDGAYRTLEGAGDKDGRMYGHYTKERPAGFLEDVPLGRVVTSPHEIWQYAHDHILNGTPYNFGINNCQQWARVLAAELGEHIHEQLKEVDSLCGDEAYILGMGSALLGNLTNSSG